MPTELQSFLVKDYELKIRYLSDHFTRMWVRFNFFVTIQVALSTALFGWLKDHKSGAVQIAVIGAVSCACWYIFGAQDRYLVEAYRKHLDIVAHQLAAMLDIRKQLETLHGLDPQHHAFITIGDVAASPVPPKIWQWRFKPLSTTTLVAWFPLVVAAYWLILIASM